MHHLYNMFIKVVVMEFLAGSCSVIGVFLHIPQLYQTYRTKDVAAFNIYTIQLRILSYALWLCYGFLARSIAVLCSGFVGFFAELVLLVMKKQYSQPIAKKTEHKELHSIDII